MGILRTLFVYSTYAILLVALFFLDLLSFELVNQFGLQALLCVYIVTLVKSQQHLLINLAFIAAMALESLIFFGHVSYGLFVALFLIPLTWVLKAWIETPLIAHITALFIATVLQQSILLANQRLDTINFLTLIGHFCINALFLSIYWFFDKNGKQGNRS